MQFRVEFDASFVKLLVSYNIYCNTLQGLTILSLRQLFEHRKQPSRSCFAAKSLHSYVPRLWGSITVASESRDTKKGLELQERHAAITAGLESVCCSLAEQSSDLAQGLPIPAQRQRLLCKWAERRKLGSRGQNLSEMPKKHVQKSFILNFF